MLIHFLETTPEVAEYVKSLSADNPKPFVIFRYKIFICTEFMYY